MSERTTRWLAATTELLLGMSVVLVILRHPRWTDPFTWGHMLEDLHLPELLTVSVAIWLVEIIPRLVAVVALIWMIRIYLGKPDDGPPRWRYRDR